MQPNPAGVLETGVTMQPGVAIGAIPLNMLAEWPSPR